MFTKRAETFGMLAVVMVALLGLFVVNGGSGDFLEEFTGYAVKDPAACKTATKAKNAARSTYMKKKSDATKKAYIKALSAYRKVCKKQKVKRRYSKNRK